VAAKGLLVVLCGTIKNLSEVTLVFRQCQRNQKKVQIKNPIKNYVSHTLADISKTKDAPGYNPEYSLEKCIRELI
jgi:nucleoside-diphosphate-sugar epimerase